MICSMCGKEIPDDSVFCSECGAFVEKVKEPEKVEESVKTPEPVKEEPEGTPEPVKEEPEGTPEPVKEETDMDAPAGNPEGAGGKKKGKLGIILGVVFGVLLLIAAIIDCLFLFAKDKAINFVHVHFDKPETYYQYVLSKNYLDNPDLDMTWYASNVKEQMNVLNMAAHEKVELRLGERGKEFVKLANEVGYDFSWIDSVGATYGMDLQARNKALALNGAGYVNGVLISSGNIMMDLATGVLVAQVPEISEKYIMVDMSDSYHPEDLIEILEQYQSFIDAMPDSEFYRKKLLTYFGFYLEQIDEVEKTKEIVEADDLMEEYTCLSVTLKEKDIRAIADRVIEDIMEDVDIEIYIRKLADISGKEADKIYEEFREGCKEALDPEKQKSLGINKMIWKIYVDKNSKIVGMNALIEPTREEDGNVEFETAFLQKDSKCGYVYHMKDARTNLYVQGSGTLKNGILEGDFGVKVNDKKAVNVVVKEWDIEAGKKRQLKGRFLVKQGKDVDLVKVLCEDLFDLEEDSPAYVLLAGLDPSLEIMADVTSESHRLEFGVQDGGVDIIRLLFEGGIDAGQTISLPEGGIDIDKNPEEYVKDISLDKVINALKEAKVPEKYYQELLELKAQIEEYLEYMEMLKKYK